MIAVGLVSLMLFAVTFHDVRLSLWILLFMAFYLQYVIDVFSMPNIYTNLPFVAILLLIARQISYVGLRRRVTIRTPLTYPIIGLLIFIAISFLVGTSSPQSAFKATLKHATFVCTALVIISVNFSEAFLKKLIRAILIIAFVQIPASIIQYYFLYSDFPGGARYDASGGLLAFNSGGINAVFMTFIFSILLGFMITHGPRLRYIMAAGGLLIPIILSSARAGIVFFGVTGMLTVSAFVLSQKSINTAIKTIAYGAIGLVCMIVVVFVFAREDQLGFLTNTNRMYEYSMKQNNSLGRLAAPGNVHSIIGNSPKRAMFGLGVGTLTHTSLLGRNESDFYEENERILKWPNSYTYVTLELGYGGLLLFLYLHVKVLAYNRIFLKNINDPYWKAISIGLIGIVFTSMYSILYTSPWLQPSLMFCFWFIAGSIYRVGRLRGIFGSERVVVRRYLPSHRTAGVLSYRQ